MTTTAEISTRLFDRIEVEVDFRFKDQVKSIPGARWDNDLRIWSVPLTWPSCLALRTEFPKGQLTIGPVLTEWAAAEKRRKATLRNHRHDLEYAGERPDLPMFDLLKGYQMVGARLASMAQGYLILDDMGAGKTWTSLAAVALAQQNGLPPGPVIVVCPKTMLRTWCEEIPKFFPAAEVRRCEGTPTKVKKALEPGADFYVINYDLIAKYSRVAGFGNTTLSDTDRLPKELQALGATTLIADEIHKAKTPKNAWTRALWAISSTVHLRLGLTGTPIQESPEDMWSLLHTVAPEEYPTKTPYVDRYLDVSMNQWDVRQINGLLARTQDEFRANFETRFRRITKEVALPYLPPKIFETRWVILPPKLRKAYKEMTNNLMAELESGDVLTADSVLTRAGRLIQLANSSGEVEIIPEDCKACGAVGLINGLACEHCDGQGIRNRQKFHFTMPSPKVEGFMDDLKNGDYDGKSIAIYSDSRELVDLLDEQLTKAKRAFVRITGEEGAAERDEAERAFQAGEVPIILLTRAGGTGITLTTASVMVRLMRSWSLVSHYQAEDRVHRIGSEQHESILYVDYITADTVEEGQIIRLNHKELMAQDVLRDSELLAMIKEYA